jgi:predicted O-methyltransferase YrrM
MTSREATSLLARNDLDWPTEVRRGIGEKLHVVAFALIQWPWLLRSLSGGDAADRARLLGRLDLPADALPHLGSWKADAGFLNLLVDHIERARPQQVVELGAGASSLVLGRALQLHGGGRLTSCDQHGDFVIATRAWLADHGIRADLRATPLVPAPGDWPGIWYDTSLLPDRIDMLVIDGPPWTIHPQVRGAAESLFDRLPVGGTVMLDDAARPGERIVAKSWRRRWPGFDFRLRHAGTKGTLVGTRMR